LSSSLDLTPSILSQRYTYTFTRSHLAPTSRVLEVGCGSGWLTLALSREGLNVTAIDVSKEAVREANSMGIPAEVCDFLEFPVAERFSSVLFTRSIHHISPVAHAMDRVLQLLDRGGKVIIEDFDFRSMDRSTAEWFYGLAGVLHSAGHLKESELTAIGARPPLEYWLEDHRYTPPLNAGSEIIEAAHASFGEVSVQRVPYLFRYFCRDLPADGRGYQIARKIWDWELGLIETNSIRPIGLRLVAGG
jgi:SAM-dependent methyltransferase